MENPEGSGKTWVRKTDEVTILQKHIEARIHVLGIKVPRTYTVMFVMSLLL